MTEVWREIKPAPFSLGGDELAGREQKNLCAWQFSYRVEVVLFCIAYLLLQHAQVQRRVRRAVGLYREIVDAELAIPPPGVDHCRLLAADRCFARTQATEPPPKPNKLLHQTLATSLLQYRCYLVFDTLLLPARSKAGRILSLVCCIPQYTR
jgi:hypothetical protein